MRNFFLSLCMIAIIVGVSPAHADEAAGPIGIVAIQTGQMKAIRDGESITLAVGDLVFEGDELVTGDDSVAKVILTGDETNNINLGKNARLKMTSYKVSEAGEVLGGHFEAVSGFYTMSLLGLREGADFSFATDVATLKVAGTSWAIDTAGNMVCTSGQLIITHAATGKTFTVNPGQMFSLRGFQNNPVVSTASEAIMRNIDGATKYNQVNESTKNVLHNRLGGEADGRVTAMSMDLNTGNLYADSEFESFMEFAGTAIYAVGRQFPSNTPSSDTNQTPPQGSGGPTPASPS